jgi:vacuolar-type H+-ATPase subunit C/Vma6
MFRVCKYSYAYVKIFGKIAKSYLGRNLENLINLRKVSEMYNIVFPHEQVDISEYDLTKAFQKKITDNNISSIIYIISLLKDPHPVLIHFLRMYEYQNLKSVIQYIKNEETISPYIWDIGEYSSFKFTKAEEYEENIAASPYKWILKDKGSLFEIQNKLDKQYYIKLAEIADTLKKPDKKGIKRIISNEILYQNIVWAFRLRFFFNIEKEEASGYLIPDKRNRNILELFDFASDNPSEWREWKYYYLVEEQMSAGMTGLDPVRIEENAVKYMARLVKKLFHQDPFTLTPFVCFIKLKIMEANLLKSVIEGFTMNMTAGEILTILDIK